MGRLSLDLFFLEDSSPKVRTATSFNEPSFYVKEVLQIPTRLIQKAHHGSKIDPWVLSLVTSDESFDRHKGEDPLNQRYTKARIDPSKVVIRR